MAATDTDPGRSRAQASASPPSGPALRRDLTLAHTLALGVGITIGTGVFLKSAVMAQAVDSPALVLLAWLAAGLIAMIGALTFAELGAMLPDAGGEYVFLRAAYGDLPGYLYVCMSFVIGSASLAAYGAAVAIFLGDVVPLGEPWVVREIALPGGELPWQFGPRQLIAAGIVATFVMVNLAAVGIGGRVQTALTATKVLGVVALIAGVLIFGRGTSLGNLAPPPGAEFSIAGFGTAVFAALWAYSGWQYVPMVSAEIRDPQRNVPRALIGGTLIVLALYGLVNFAYFYALPYAEVASANSTLHPNAPSAAAKAAQSFLGTSAISFAALVFLVSTVGSMNGVLLTRARVPYAAARDGLFFSAFAHVNERTRVPSRSVVISGVVALGLALTGTFDQLTNMAVLSYAVFWAPVGFAVLVLRRRLPDLPRPYRVPGYPWVPTVFGLLMTWIVINTFWTQPLESLATLAMLLAGLPFYPLLRARGSLPAAPSERS